LHYVVLGIPGMPYKWFNDHYYWREATREVEHLAAGVARETRQKPIVVGMTKWSVASALSFYERKEDPMDIRSRNFFGPSGAMYDFWQPADLPTDRPIILVSMKAHLLEHNGEGFSLEPMLAGLGPIERREIMRDGKPLREIYYRIAHVYKGIHLPADKKNRGEDDPG
jgi:dolichol-phosphate mannosyltransferase